MTATTYRRLQFPLCSLLAGLSVQTLPASTAWAATDAPHAKPQKTTDGSTMQPIPSPNSSAAGVQPMPEAAALSQVPQVSQEDLLRAIARVKAEYLYRFLSYVEFPRSALSQADTPLVIGIANADAVYDALADTLAMRTVGTRQVLRRKLSSGDSLAGVHLLFNGGRDLAQDPLVSQARSAPILLVTDAPGGLAAGAVFNFLMLGDQLRFEVSLEAASRASLTVSSRVLVLAEKVKGAR